MNNTIDDVIREANIFNASYIASSNKFTIEERERAWGLTLQLLFPSYYQTQPKLNRESE